MNKTLLQILREGNHTLVVKNNGSVETFDRRGIRELLALLEVRPEFLKGAEVADKVVGKAAAALMISGGVKHISTGVASRLAIDLLQAHRVSIEFEKEVPYIINRDQTAICPLEAACKPTENLSQCLQAVADFVRRVREQKSKNQ